MATEAGRSIERNKTTWQREDSALLWYGSPSYCVHASKGHHLKSELTTKSSNGGLHSMIRMKD